MWHALTYLHLLARWLMPNDFPPAVGHQFTFRTEPVPQHGFDGSGFRAPPRGWTALAHDGFDDGDPGSG